MSSLLYMVHSLVLGMELHHERTISRSRACEMSSLLEMVHCLVLGMELHPQLTESTFICAIRALVLLEIVRILVLGLALHHVRL